MNVFKELEMLTNKDWKNLFSAMEIEERKTVSVRNDNLLYRYIGEIDDPKEMLFDFATMEDIRKCGGKKTNWFICSDGTFFTCGDCATDALFDSGRVVDNEFPFEIERMEKYYHLSRNEKISFRIKLQGITKEESERIISKEYADDFWD